MNQTFDQSLKQQVTQNVQNLQKQLEKRITAEVREELFSQFDAMYRQKILEFKAEEAHKKTQASLLSSSSGSQFLAVKQNQIHPMLLQQIQTQVKSESVAISNELLKKDYNLKIQELKSSLEKAVEENAEKYRLKLKKMLDMCNNKILDQKKKYEAKIEFLKERWENEQGEISRRGGRAILINQYEEVLQEKQRIINQFQAEQVEVMKKLDNLKLQMHKSNLNDGIDNQQQMEVHQQEPFQVAFNLAIVQEFETFHEAETPKHQKTPSKSSSQSSQEFSIKSDLNHQKSIYNNQESLQQLQEYSRLSQIVNQDFNKTNKLKQESIYREPSLMKEYYSWMQNKDLEASESPEKLSKNQGNTYAENLFKKNECVSFQSQTGEDLPNLCNLGRSKLFESGETDLEDDFKMEIHNCADSIDIQTDIQKIDQNTYNLVKNLKFDLQDDQKNDFNLNHQHRSCQSQHIS